MIFMSILKFLFRICPFFYLLFILFLFLLTLLPVILVLNLFLQQHLLLSFLEHFLIFHNFLMNTFDIFTISLDLSFKKFFLFFVFSGDVNISDLNIIFNSAGGFADTIFEIRLHMAMGLNELVEVSFFR